METSWRTVKTGSGCWYIHSPWQWHHQNMNKWKEFCQLIIGSIGYSSPSWFFPWVIAYDLSKSAVGVLDHLAGGFCQSYGYDIALLFGLLLAKPVYDFWQLVPRWLSTTILFSWPLVYPLDILILMFICISIGCWLVNIPFLLCYHSHFRISSRLTFE